MGELRVFQTHKQVVAKKLRQTSGMVEFVPELSALRASSEQGKGGALSSPWAVSVPGEVPKSRSVFFAAFASLLALGCSSRSKARSHPP